MMEVDDFLEKLLLLGLVSLEQVYSLREFIYREIILPRLHATCHKACGAHEEAREGIQEAGDNPHLPRGKATKGKRSRLSINLGDDFAEEQEQECQDDGLHDEAQSRSRGKIEDQAEGIAREDDDCHIDEIIANEDGC